MKRLLIRCLASAGLLALTVGCFGTDGRATKGSGQSTPETAQSKRSAIKQTASNEVVALPELVSADGYIGSDACQSCHAEHHQSWHTSYHRTMTQPVDSSTAPTAIEAGETTVAGDNYRFRREGDQYHVTQETSTGASRDFRLVMMTGSHHMHVFWYDSGVAKTPSMLPIVYLLDQQRWIPRGSAFLRTPGHDYEAEQGRWNSTCCLCHSTHPRPHVSTDRAAADGWETEVSEFGISCEACHGPGEGHAQIHQATNQDAATEGSTSARDRIVDPMNLDADLQSEMCVLGSTIVRGNPSRTRVAIRSFAQAQATSMILPWLAGYN